MKSIRRALNALWLTLLLTVTPAVAADGDQAAGDEAWTRGDWPAALVAWSDALQDARQANDTDVELDLLIRLAGAHRQLGRIDLAADVLKLAEPLADDDQDRADLAMATGLQQRHLGDLAAAASSFKKAYGRYRKVEDPQGAANAALNLGTARLLLGAITEAGKALDAAGTLFGTLADDRGEADVLVNMALLERRRGDLHAARTNLIRAKKSFSRLNDAAGEADVEANLALIEAALGRPEAAEKALRRALETAEARKDVARQGTLRRQLGVLAWRRGDEAAALDELLLAQRAFGIASRSHDALSVALDRALLDPPDSAGFDTLVTKADDLGDSRLLARAHVQAARVLLTADPGAAIDHAHAALRLAKRFELSEIRWQALYVIGRRAQLDRQPEPALDSLTEAVDILERRRRLLGDDDAAAFAEEHAAVYNALAEVYLTRGKPLQALAVTERLALSDQPLDPRHGSTQKLEGMAAREAWLEERFVEAVSRNGETARSDELRKQLADLRVAFAETVDRMRATVSDLDRRVRVDPEDLEAIQAELPPDVAVLQPIVLDDRLVLMVFRRDRLQAIEVDVARDELEGTVGKLGRALRAGLRDPAVLDPLASKLGGWLWEPAAQALDGTEVLVVSTTGALRQVPFALLRHDDRYLIEDRAVVAISNVGSLRGSSDPLVIGDDTLLLVGNPDGSLPGAEAEVEALHQVWPDAALLVGETATRARILQKLDGRSAVHLATHGRIDSVTPASSYLVLASDDDDGRLGYREIPGLAPWLGSARMVVLSACESGRPVDAKGGEGVISIQGLAAQFRRAGVETLVASLWKVDDQGTRALMERFYAELAAGRDAARAMQAAQVALLHSETYRTPWVWAAFVVAGDWR